MSPSLLRVRREAARDLAEQLSKETRIPVEDILGKTKDAQVVRVRHRLWAMLCDRGLSSSVVGDILGRDHTSILYGVKRARARGVAMVAGKSGAA